MRNTERRSWSIGDIGIRLVLLSLAALMMMALQQTGRFKAVQSFVTQLTSPAQVGATGVTENVTDLFSFFVELRTLRQRNSELEQINSSLVVENFRLREVERENQQFREMFNFAQTRPGWNCAARRSLPASSARRAITSWISSCSIWAAPTASMSACRL